VSALDYLDPPAPPAPREMNTELDCGCRVFYDPRPRRRDQVLCLRHGAARVQDVWVLR